MKRREEWKERRGKRVERERERENSAIISLSSYDEEETASLVSSRERRERSLIQCVQSKFRCNLCVCERENERKKETYTQTHTNSSQA